MHPAMRRFPDFFAFVFCRGNPLPRPAEPYVPAVPMDRTSLTDDERIANVVPLPPPEHLIRFFPVQGTPAEDLITQTRDRIRQTLRGGSDRLLVVIGPCSIHDPNAAIEYAGRLAGVR